VTIDVSTAAELPPIDDGAAGVRSLDALLDVSLPVVIEIGRTQLTVQDVLNLAPGAVIELDRTVGEPVDIFVGDRRFAQGEIVVVGDQFAVRVTQLLQPGEAAA